jgi:hypothetical protein
MINSNQKEHQLLALLYRVEELLLELRVGSKESDDYKSLENIIKNLENHIQNNQDLT